RGRSPAAAFAGKPGCRRASAHRQLERAWGRGSAGKGERRTCGRWRGASVKAWPAFAKLNLFLHIVGRRADGYHLLQTVFRFIDYGDELHFSVREDDAVVLETPLPGVPPEQDLTVRAARLLQQAAGV